MDIIEHRAEVAGIETFWRQGGAARVLYVHGNPNNSDLWLPFLARAGGVAMDLPGYGRSAKPAQFDYSIGGYADWLAELSAGAHGEAALPCIEPQMGGACGNGAGGDTAGTLARG